MTLHRPRSMLGRPGSSFVGKIFMSGDLPAARSEIRRLYGSERSIRPEAARSNRIEIFALGAAKP